MTALYHHHDTRAIVHRLRVRLARRERRDRPGAQRAVDRRNAWRHRALMQLGHWPDGTALGWGLAILDAAFLRFQARRAPAPACQAVRGVFALFGFAVLFWGALYFVASSPAHAEDFRMEVPAPVSDAPGGC